MAKTGESDVFHGFVGREDFLQDLRHQWNKYRIFAVFGFKSVGKTRTVEEFLRRLVTEHPNPDTVSHVYIDLKSVKSPQNFLFQIKTALCLIYEDLHDDMDLLVEEILLKLRTSVKVDRFILNFDNAEDVIESPTKDVFVMLCEILIERSHCLTIVLTSFVNVDFPGQRGNFYAVELPLLSHTDGVELLRSVTPNVKYTATFHQIVELCLGLPLAILMTGSELQMDNGYLSPEQMVDILTRSNVPVSHRLEAWSRDYSYAKQEQIGHVYSTYLKRLSKVFRKRLSVLGYIPGSFTTSHAQQLLGDPSVQTTTQLTLCPLADRHMIMYEYDAGRCRYNIHGIIRDCLNAYFTLDLENLREIRKRYCEMFCKVVQGLSWMMTVSEFWSAVADLAVEYPNVQKLLILVENSCQETFHIYIQMVKSSAELIEQYFGGDSVKFYNQLLELCTKYDNPRSNAIVSRAYGMILTNVKGEFADGEMMYRRALGYFMMDIAPFICQNLGWNLYLQGRMREALECLQRAHRYQITLGMKMEWVALATLTSIGLVHVGMGNFDEGEKYQMESIKRRIEKHGEDHPHVGSMYNNLGELFDQRGDHEKSSFYFRKGLELKKTNNGSSSAIILSIHNVASVEINNRRFGEAKKLLDEAWSLLQQRDMAYRVHETATLETYGKLYLAEGSYKKAVRIFETITTSRKIAIGGSIGHVDSILSLGKALRRGGNPAKALQVFQEALTHREGVAREVPQNTVIWECLEEIADIVTDESSLSKEGNSRDMMQVFSDGKKELLRIIGHFTEKGITEKRAVYERKLIGWNRRHDEFICKEGDD